MEDITKLSQAAFTVLCRRDPPDKPLSEEGAKEVLQLANEIAQLYGYRELGRDEQSHQVELHLRRHL